MNKKMIILSAPSGSGKTTIVKHLMKKFHELSFSISATSRLPRSQEKHGIDYYFLNTDDFKEKINQNQFLEWEEVYKNTYYGTLKSELDRIASENKVAIFDVDVVGGINIKKQYRANSLAIFIKAPSLNILEQRLRNRGTDTDEVIRQRLAKAQKELDYAPEFDKIIVNDNLERACSEAEQSVRNFIDK